MKSLAFFLFLKISQKEPCLILYIAISLLRSYKDNPLLQNNTISVAFVYSNIPILFSLYYFLYASSILRFSYSDILDSKIIKLSQLLL